MTLFTQTTAIILAAGLSRRFGADDKLTQTLGDLPVGLHIARTLSHLPLARTIAVTSSQAQSELYQSMNCDTILNDTPEIGMGRSLALALTSIDQPHVMICLADMPFVTATHLQALATAYQAANHRPVRSVQATYRGPPALVSLADLNRADLNGDHGARALLADSQIVQASADELSDIDTTAALDHARDLWAECHKQSRTRP